MKQLINWILTITTVGAMVAQAFYSEPWIEYAARVGYFMQGFWMTLGVLVSFTLLGEKARENFRKGEKPRGWLARTSVATMNWMRTIVFIGMGWYWLGVASLIWTLTITWSLNRERDQLKAAAA